MGKHLRDNDYVIGFENKKVVDEKTNKDNLLRELNFIKEYDLKKYDSACKDIINKISRYEQYFTSGQLAELKELPVGTSEVKKANKMLKDWSDSLKDANVLNHKMVEKSNEIFKKYNKVDSKKQKEVSDALIKINNKFRDRIIKSERECDKVDDFIFYEVYHF